MMTFTIPALSLILFAILLVGIVIGMWVILTKVK